MVTNKLFDTSFLNDLKERTNIVDLVGQRLSLKKSGAHTYTCCCPFHDEKTPSFVINEKENRFKCFGGSCGESGDPISFLEKYERLSFPEAVRALCHFNGVQPPENDEESKKQNSERKKYLRFARALSGHLMSEIETKAGQVLGNKIPATDAFKSKLQIGTIADRKRLERILTGASMKGSLDILKRIEVLDSKSRLNLPSNGLYLPVATRRGAVTGFTFIDGRLEHHILPESDSYRPECELINLSNIEHSEPCYFAFNFKNAIQVHRHFQTDNILISPLGDGMISEEQLTKSRRVGPDLTFVVPAEPDSRHSALASLLVNYRLGDEIRIFDMKTGKENYLLDFMSERWGAFPELLKSFYTEAVRDTDADILLDVLSEVSKEKSNEPSPAA